MCVYVSTSSASTTRSHPSTFVAKARCSYGGVMGCAIQAGEKEPLHDSALSLTGPPAITLPLRSQTLSIFLLFLASLVQEPEARGIQFSGHPLSRILVRIHPSIHPLLSPRPLDISSTGHFIRRGLGHLSDNNTLRRSPGQ